MDQSRSPVPSATSNNDPDSLLELIRRCNDLLQNVSRCSYLDGIAVGKQLSDFLEMMKQIQYRIKNKHNTKSNSPANVPLQDECGSNDEEHQTDIDITKFEENHLGDLNLFEISLWLDDKEKEIQILKRFLKIMEQNNNIMVTSSSHELDHVTIDYSCVVYFKLPIPSNGEKSVYKTDTLMNSTASKNSINSTTTIKLPWHRNKEQMRCIRKQMRQFVSFAKANRLRDEIKFVAYFCDSEECTSSITLFKNGVPEEFDPPVNPDHVKPSPGGVTFSSVRLEWSKPEYGYDSVQHYTVCYGQKDEPEDQWKSKKSDANETSLTLTNLQSESVYLFKVRAECETGVSEYSPVSDPILTLPTPPRYLSDLLERSSVLPLSDSRLPVYLINTDDDYIKEGIRHVRIGKPTETVENKVLMVVGATGAGKSTLINGMINYILGVQWKDDFRFKLITDKAKSQAQSQANNIAVYTIHAMPGSLIPYSFTIIDTPGFEDTSGFEQDLLIMAKIKQFLTMQGCAGISHLNGIGLVAQSALMRLTPTQKYVFDSVLSIFGRDIAQSICIMITFADGQTPPVMTAIKEANIPHTDVFKFNNSALYAIDSADSDNFDEMFWKMGMESFNTFFALFSDTENIGLATTVRVLEVRDEVQALAVEFQKLLKECLTEIEILQQAKTTLLTVEAEVSANKQFTQEIQIEYQKTDIETALFKRKKTFPELKKRYESALIRKSAIEKEIGTRQQKLQETYIELQTVATRASDCLVTLNEIALNPFPFTSVEYIQLLINLEQKEAKEGWLNRVSFMETVKEQVKVLFCLRQSVDFDDIHSQIERQKELKRDATVGVLEKLQRIAVYVH